MAEPNWKDSTLRIAVDPATGRSWAMMGFGPGAVVFNPQTGEQFFGDVNALQWGGQTGQFQTYDPDPNPSTLEKLWPYATAALGGGALAGSLGAAGGAGGLASLGPVATEGFAGAAPALGAAAGQFSVPASLAGVSGATVAGTAAGKGAIEAFLSRQLERLPSSLARRGISRFASQLMQPSPTTRGLVRRVAPALAAAPAASGESFLSQAPAIAQFDATQAPATPRAESPPSAGEAPMTSFGYVGGSSSYGSRSRKPNKA